eukprot:scaffold158907_cov15-Tisochrysis_lutea.AAC.1
MQVSRNSEGHAMYRQRLHRKGKPKIWGKCWVFLPCSAKAVGQHTPRASSQISNKVPHDDMYWRGVTIGNLVFCRGLEAQTAE